MAIANDAFASKMMKALARAGVDGLRYDPGRFALVRSDGRGEFFLGSAHQFYNEASFWTRGRVLKHYAATMFNRPLFEYPATFDEARGNLVPVVHSLAYLDIAELLGLTGPNPPETVEGRPRYVPLAGSLAVGLAYDTPLALGSFPASQLDQWGVSFDDAMKAARYNLSVRSRDPMEQVAPGLFMAPWQDANAAGRLVLTELLTRLPVKGDVIASVPGRDYLLVAGSDDTDALAAMVVVIEKALAQPKGNTPELYRLDGTTWRPYRLPADHPLAAKHAELLAGLASDDYREQKKLIEALHARRNIDVAVATHFAMRRDDGSVYSYCVWPDRPASLPQAEMIAVTNGAGEPRLFPWDAVAAVVGDKLQPHVDYRLPRYLAAGPLNDAEKSILFGNVPARPTRESSAARTSALRDRPSAR